MLFDVIRSLAYGYHVDVWQIVAQVVSIVFVILCILPLHEFAHGWVANKLGDPTAKLAGRLTLNPLASVDPVGTVALILFGFGWAKPVPVDSRYFKKPRRDVALTALAGPVSNLLAALVGAFLCGAITPGVEIYRGLYNVVSKGDFEQPYDPVGSFDNGEININFQTTNADQRFFFKYLAR